ncbi:hypothetical protein ACL9RF_04380 [Sphingobacterium sp. Mn56C]|uniref:hypothetical protein n=1 Tax=Sphingobacterium sp. Mn56C TaxID=3395261 RepID=UPI003BE95FFE
MKISKKTQQEIELLLLITGHNWDWSDPEEEQQWMDLYTAIDRFKNSLQRKGLWK